MIQVFEKNANNIDPSSLSIDRFDARKGIYSVCSRNFSELEGVFYSEVATGFKTSDEAQKWIDKQCNEYYK